MTIERMGPEAIKRITAEMMEHRPRGATGIYVAPTGMLYGSLSRSVGAVPNNYIFFEDEPTLPRYTQPIQANSTSGDTVTLVMNARQAHVLYQLSRRISGEPRGPRGVLTTIGNALESVMESVIPSKHTAGDFVEFGDYSMFLRSGNHDA